MRPLAVRFLASGSHAGATAGDNSATYVVTWTYNDDTTIVQVIDVNGMNSATRRVTGARSAGDGTDEWDVFWGITYTTGIPTNCTDSFSEVYLDEIVADNAVLTQDVRNVTIEFASGLNGPVAISYALSPADYAAVFTSYKGSYISAEGTLPEPIGGDNAIWYGVSWTQDIDDGAGTPEFYGDLYITVWCGDGGGSYTASITTYSSGVDDDDGTVPLQPIDIDGDGTYCSGTDVRYLVDFTVYG